MERGIAEEIKEDKQKEKEEKWTKWWKELGSTVDQVAWKCAKKHVKAKFIIA